MLGTTVMIAVVKLVLKLEAMGRMQDVEKNNKENEDSFEFQYVE